METNGHGPGPDDSHETTGMIHAHDMEEAQRLIEGLQKAHPEHRVEALHIRAGLVEAGIQVTVQGQGLYAQVTLDPTVDPAITYHILEHIPDAVQSALGEMVGSVIGDDADGG